MDPHISKIPEYVSDAKKKLLKMPDAVEAITSLSRPCGQCPKMSMCGKLFAWWDDGMGLYSLLPIDPFKFH